MRTPTTSMVALSCLALALVSCGGGGGGGAPPPPPPPPAPVPPPPPPPPPPPAATARAFTAVPVTSFYYFYSSRDRLPNDPSFSGAYGNRQGQITRVFGGFQTAFFGPLAGRELSTLDSFSLASTGVEQAGTTFHIFLAPAGSRSFSPTTTLIEWAQSQDLVKRALGLDGGIFGLQTNPDLTRYDAVAALASASEDERREGARVGAANLRAMAVAAVAERVGQAGFDPFFTQYRYELVGRHIAAVNGAFLFTNAEMSRLLASATTAGRYRDDVISAAAHLVNAYAAAIGVQVADTEQAARFTLGIRGWLLEEVDLLLRANTAAAAAAALAVNSQQILDRTARYREVLPFPAAGFFFPNPDFYAVPAGGQLVVQTQGASSLGANDFYANGPTGSIGFFAGPNQTLSVSVPAANAGQVSAVLRGDGTVLITALGGFTGTTYFDYSVRHNTGDEATGRVYVTVR